MGLSSFCGPVKSVEERLDFLAYVFASGEANWEFSTCTVAVNNFWASGSFDLATAAKSFGPPNLNSLPSHSVELDQNPNMSKKLAIPV